MLIMHAFFFSPSNENCGCNGNRNSQMLQKHIDPEIIQKLFKLQLWWQCANYARHFFFRRILKFNTQTGRGHMCGRQQNRTVQNITLISGHSQVA